MITDYSEETQLSIQTSLQLLTMKNTPYKLYCITADYRKENENKPHYYVLAKSPHEAKMRFKSKISWLDIYGCSPCGDEFSMKVVKNPLHYIVF